MALLSHNVFANEIANALNAEEQEKLKANSGAVAQECSLLSIASQGTLNNQEKVVLGEQIAFKLKSQNINMLRARADVARKGLYGFEKNPSVSMKYYQEASELGSIEASYNYVLMLLEQSNFKPTQEVANLMLTTLQKNGGLNYNVKGVVSQYARYISGRIYEDGLAGQKDIGQAYILYRDSARSGYVPAAERYISLMLMYLPQMTESQKADGIKEMTMMLNRWKWNSAEMMRLTGDAYASGYLPDTKGFQAQYHWRIAAMMPGGYGKSPEIMSRISSMPIENEERLMQSVKSSLKNNASKVNTKKRLEYIDLCN